jgi:hypothetical protein
VDVPGCLTSDDLNAPVEASLGTRVDRIEGWTVEPLAGGAGETLGVWRVTGEATVNGAVTPFTMILKGWLVPDSA